jgi:hypothetical protein
VKTKVHLTGDGVDVMPREARVGCTGISSGFRVWFPTFELSIF